MNEILNKTLIANSIRQACKDLQKVIDEDPDIIIDMTMWIYKGEYQIYMCLSGAYMYKTLGASLETLGPEDFPQRKIIEEINLVRSGYIASNLGFFPKLYAQFDPLYEYNSNFIPEMLRRADVIEKYEEVQ